MTCKDCVHHDLCFDNGTLFLRYAKGLDSENVETNCPFKNFKNKSEFVEVVRCKDCDRSAKYKDYYLCGVDNRAVNADSFCSYGERRTDDDL